LKLLFVVTNLDGFKNPGINLSKGVLMSGHPELINDILPEILPSLLEVGIRS